MPENGRTVRGRERSIAANNYAMRRERGIHMSETNTDANQANPTAEEGSSGSAGGSMQEFRPIESQEEFDRRIAPRVNREKAKTAAEKQRADDALKELGELKAANEVRGWKDEVAEVTGVPANLLRGSTKEEIEAHAKEIAAVIAPPSAPVVESDGKQPSKPKADPYAEMASGLFGN